MSRVLYRRANAKTATRTTIVRDGQTGLPIIRQVQDVAGILEQNQRDAAAFDSRRAARNPGGFRHVARIPMVVVAQLRQLGIMRGMTVVDEKRFLQFLSSSDTQKLRCDDGARLG